MLIKNFNISQYYQKSTFYSPQTVLYIFKSFIRSYLDYGDDQPNKESFLNKTEGLHHQAYLAITGAVKHKTY